MGPEMVFCFLLPLGPGLRLLASLLLLLHLSLLLLPFLHEATRNGVLLLSLFCQSHSSQDIHYYFSPPACTPLQIFLVRLIYVPSFGIFNFHFFSTHVLILIFGWSKRHLLLHALFLHLILATVILTFGVLLCLRIHSPIGPLLLIAIVPVTWVALVLAIALKRRQEEDKQLHTVRILHEDSEEGTSNRQSSANFFYFLCVMGGLADTFLKIFGDHLHLIVLLCCTKFELAEGQKTVKTKTKPIWKWRSEKI